MWQKLGALLFLLLAVSLVQAAPTTPTADFTDNGDGTVTHKTTGLTWKRCAEGQTWTGSTCSGTAQTYTWSQATALTSGGWRVPTIAELITIVERDSQNPAINGTIFPGTSANNFWTTTDSYGSSAKAWVVNFGDGGDSGPFAKISTYHVRLVRGGQLLDASGLYTPSSDFTDNSDGSVTHKKTSLTWKRCAEGQTWTGLDCSGNWKYYTLDVAKTLGTGGWRMPTQNELLSIVEWGKYPAVNAEIFPSTAGYGFCSASTYVGFSGYAWAVNFYSGGSSGVGAGNCTVRLVRTGQSGGTATPPTPSPTPPSDAERVFNWAESAYVQYFYPAKPAMQESQGFTYRHYTGSGNYLAVKDGKLFLLGPLSQNQLLYAGPLADWLSKAKAAGY